MEMCEIKRAFKIKFIGGSANYIAEAAGRRGQCNANETGWINSEREGVEGYKKEEYAAVEKLIGELARDGWEPLPRGLRWWSRCFRRQVK